MCLYPRPDVKDVGNGFVLFLPTDGDKPGNVVSLVLKAGGLSYTLLASHTSERLADSDASARARHALTLSARSEHRTDLLKRVARAGFTGEDTVSKLHWPVFLELDAVHLAPPDGLLLRGWFADPFEQVIRIKVRSKERCQVLDPNEWVRTPRGDVVDSLGPNMASPTRIAAFWRSCPGSMRPEHRAISRSS